jgi:hypothetical protein
MARLDKARRGRGGLRAGLSIALCLLLMTCGGDREEWHDGADRICSDESRLYRPAPFAPEVTVCPQTCGGPGNDACPESCGEPVEIQWIVEIPTATCTREPVVAAAVEGLVLVGGAVSQRPPSDPEEHWWARGSDLWVAAFDASGCPLWDDREGVADSESFSQVLGVAGSAEGGYVAVGVLDDDPDGHLGGTVWLRRYRPSGDVAWTRRETTSFPQLASGVAVDRNGGAVVVGGGFVEGLRRGWVRRFSPEGNATGSSAWLGGAVSSHVLDVVVSSEGRTWVTLWTDVRGSSTYFLGEVVDGDYVWLEPTTTRDASSARLALQLDEFPIVVESGGLVTWLALSRWSPSGELAWQNEGRGYRIVWARRAATLPNGEILAAGGDGDTGASLARFDPEGRLLAVQPVGDRVRGPASDVAIAPDGGVFVTGLVEEDCNVWVARGTLSPSG